jgi:hypothetical protein
VNEEEAELIDFFTEMKELGEPSATRFVLDRTGGLLTRDNNDNDVDVACLPPSWSKMNLCQRYTVSQGWDASADSIGIVTKIARIGEEQKRLCSWFVFPKLRVRRRIEDICSQCCLFQNTYKYRKRPSRNNNQMNSDNNNLLDESDEEEDEDNEEVPSSAPNPAAPEDDGEDGNGEDGNGDNGNGEERNDNSNDVDGDDVEEDDDVDPEILANEKKITKAAKHVTMAHAMRVLFRSFVAQANADCASKDPEPSSMLTLLVADCCQKLELPAFFSQQPGDTSFATFRKLLRNC